MVRAGLVGVAVVLLLVGCGTDDDGDAATDPDVVVNGDGAGDDTGDDPVANACPAEGCEIEIVDVVPEGDELSITWEANFLPDVSRNHIHVYWDTYTADEVSADADDRGAEQGAWEVTDAYPTYVTEGAVSPGERGDSTTICVTASDRDHAVIDAGLVDCRDVADVLES